jgi:uncharacterized protein YggE
MESSFCIDQNIMKLVLFLIGLVMVSSQDACCDKNVLSVIGAGTISTNPDIAQFTVSTTATEKTSAGALSSVNDILNQVKAILAAKGLPKANYTTQGISLYPQYSYINFYTPEITGQQASQILSVTVGNLIQNKQLIG